MLGFRKMSFEILSPPVRFTAADFAWIKVIQTMKFEQPIWNRLAVPSQQNSFWIVNGRIFVVNVLITAVLPFFSVTRFSFGILD